MRKIVIDIDNTLCKTVNSDYENSIPFPEVLLKLKEYRELGFYIILNTSRNMRSYNGNVGMINKKTIPVLTKWLSKNNIEYDELHVGKPWCGEDGFYVDDRAIRPSEFTSLSLEQISELLK